MASHLPICDFRWICSACQKLGCVFIRYRTYDTCVPSIDHLNGEASFVIDSEDGTCPDPRPNDKAEPATGILITLSVISILLNIAAVLITILGMVWFRIALRWLKNKLKHLEENGYGNRVESAPHNNTSNNINSEIFLSNSAKYDDENEENFHQQAAAVLQDNNDYKEVNELYDLSSRPRRSQLNRNFWEESSLNSQLQNSSVQIISSQSIKMPFVTHPTQAPPPPPRVVTAISASQSLSPEPPAVLLVSAPEVLINPFLSVQNDHA